MAGPEGLQQISDCNDLVCPTPPNTPIETIEQYSILPNLLNRFCSHFVLMLYSIPAGVIAVNQRTKRHTELMPSHKLSYVGTLRDARQGMIAATTHLSPTCDQYKAIQGMIDAVDNHQKLFTGDIDTFWLKPANDDQFPGK